MFLNSDLTLHEHFNHLVAKSGRLIGLLKRNSTFLSPKQKSTVYTSFVRSSLEYCNILFFKSCSFSLLARLECQQRKAAVVCLGAHPTSSNIKMYVELGWDSLTTRSLVAQMTTFYKMVYKLLPEH